MRSIAGARRVAQWAATAHLHTSAATAAAAAAAGEGAGATGGHRVGRLNHVAIAVPSVVEASAKYRDVLGFKVSAPQDLPEHGVRVAFVELANTKLELLEPLGQGSPIAKFLERNAAGGVHHICLEVDDISASVAHVGARVRLLDAKPKIGAHGLPVVFAHPKDLCGVLTELEEVQPAAQQTLQQAQQGQQRRQQQAQQRQQGTAGEG